MPKQRVEENIESESDNSDVDENDGKEENGSITRKVRKRSKIWEHFRKNEEDQESAFCNICNKPVRRKQGSTTGLWRHLQSSHENLHSKLTENTQTEKQALTFYDPNSQESKKITKAIAEMIVLDLEPYALVARRGFRNLLKTIAPRYQIPHRTTFSRSIIPAMYEQEKQKLAEKILQDLSEGTKKFNKILKIGFFRACHKNVKCFSLINLKVKKLSSPETIFNPNLDGQKFDILSALMLKKISFAEITCAINK